MYYTAVSSLDPIDICSYYDNIAKQYDAESTSQQFAWHGTDVLFGLTFPHVQQGDQVVDLGIGTGRSSESFARIGLNIVGVDGSRNMLKVCAQKHIAQGLLQSDLREGRLPFSDNTFDLVLANGVFYLIQNIEPLIAESRRILKQRGIFSFTVEEEKGNEDRVYVDHNGAWVAQDVLEKANVCEYMHPANYVHKLLKETNFAVLKVVNFFAYHSPTARINVYFTGYVTQKL